MTAPTATGLPVASVPPETLLSETSRREDVAVMEWLTRLTAADQHHPSFRRWAVPLVCALLGVPALKDAAEGRGPGIPTVAALLVAFSVPLLWRQQRPILVFAITSTVSAMSLGLEADTASDVARVVALLNVGRQVRPFPLAVCTAIAVMQTSVSVAVTGGDDGPIPTYLRTPLVAIIQSALVAAVAAAGLVGRVVNAYVKALHERAVRMEVERDQRVRLAAAAERARVAREMHDILGHTLAVIVGLANGAAGLTEAKPRRGAETLRIIADSGRGALAELRRLLAVIGDDEKATAEGTLLAPQPGLSDLTPLLERVRAAGPAVALHSEGHRTDLPPSLQLAVYRVVQEALTNTLKHAAADTTVQVVITADDTAVDVTVEDTGPSLHVRMSDEGRGLVGMRERAALYGGSVTAGPNHRGGWTVHARFEIATTPASTSTEKLAL
ncbi:sensor histidine kinase [Streptomyces blattellae]|uniref:sensor histidine kinase n=1 Tax=Streptomyces blattellae TaxID=2569855 RepID=UPI0012B92C1B|nr:histidine kinase [Streptomyces blattellae]